MKPLFIPCLVPTITGLLLTPLASQAAVITWGTPTPVSTSVGNSSDVSTNGTLIGAFNAQALGPALTSPVVNGVTFTGKTTVLPGGLNTGGSDISEGTNGGDASYDALLSRFDYGGGPNQITISMGGGALEIGEIYEVQIWFVDDRPASDENSIRFGDGNGNTVDLNDEYIIGTFTANGSSQSLTLDPQGYGNSHINAYQIRHIPEPSSALLSALAGVALLIHRRRK